MVATKREPKGNSSSSSSSSSSIKEYCRNSEPFRLAKLLFSLIQERLPKAKKPNLQRWARDVDLMIRRENRTVDEIEAVIQWCQHDSFWRKNIRSPAKLREKFDQLQDTMQGAVDNEPVEEWFDVPD